MPIKNIQELKESLDLQFAIHSLKNHEEIKNLIKTRELNHQLNTDLPIKEFGKPHKI